MAPARIAKIAKFLMYAVALAAMAVGSVHWWAQSKLGRSPQTPNVATGEIQAVEFKGVVKFTDPQTARIWDLSDSIFMISIFIAALLAALAQHYERKLDPYWRFTEARKLADEQQFVYERRKWMRWLPPWK